MFQNYPFDDIQEGVPLRSFQLPFHHDHGTVEVALIPLDLGYWLLDFVLLCFQAVFNSFVALVAYEFLLPQRNNKANHNHRLLLGYGIVVPGLLLGTLWIFHYWQSPNITLMMCAFGAIPNILTLRVIEAMHGKLPAYCVKSRRMTCLYFSSTLLLAVDKSNRPVLLTPRIFWDKFLHFASVFLQTSALLSILLATNYQVFPSSGSILHWGHLGNSFLLASLTALVLDGGSSGLGLLTMSLTGYVLEDFHCSPLTQSTSPSDFWGRRWNRPVQSALKRGCYTPLRDMFSSVVAAFLTFLVSGCIHEYALLAMSSRGGNRPENFAPRYGRQFIFFFWNGIVLVLERCWTRWAKETSFGLARIPRLVRTALVLLMVLPIGHFFTDEFIRASFYDDCSWGFPIVVLVMSK